MTSTKKPHSTSLFSRKLVAVRCMAEDTHMENIKIRMPRSTRPELVLRSIHSRRWIARDKMAMSRISATPTRITGRLDCRNICTLSNTPLSPSRDHSPLPGPNSHTGRFYS